MCVVNGNVTERELAQIKDRFDVTILRKEKLSKKHKITEDDRYYVTLDVDWSVWELLFQDFSIK